MRCFGYGESGRLGYANLQTIGDDEHPLIAGDVSAWARIEWPFEEAPAALVISSVVSESRSLTTELRQVLKALDLPVAKAAASGPSRLELLLGGGAG